ncbi:hypothetical protein [Bradyrhizobium betae]|uniref:SARP family transcriptional regulator n=1 Tax=Bradyrhizobium betae TaxID=244734 RepID=A0A5P6PEN5_9BRAD|nr:hypothetical protein [Bradyrhizobium betae]MCS3726173.1 tetratricopeptide (TPR) repeat protein [Bradyrhizobium betae]QFI76750.1 hypothetical protein F8237_32730 [Bradyrhizobium betae]
MSSDPKLLIKLLGPFRMQKASGEDCTPKGRKACALVAMLTLAPEHKRSRVWLQDKLWGSRGKEQGAASLRQSLTEIRRALGDAQAMLLADSFVISLDPKSFKTDVAGDMASSGFPSRAGPTSQPTGELLEGFDIAEEEFEDWLREERGRFRGRVAASPTPVRAAEIGPAADQPARNRIILTRGCQTGPADIAIMADSLVDSIAKTITELGVAAIQDQREAGAASMPPTNDGGSSSELSLRSDVFGSDATKIVRVALLQHPKNTLAWSSTLQMNGGLDLNDANTMRMINLIVNFAVDKFAQVEDCGPNSAPHLCYAGILHLFRLGRINFETADRMFAAAFETEPRGIYLAWRAYLRTFMLAERQFSCRQTLEAEAFDFMYRALELEPYNSYVASLSAHVQSMMRRAYVAAYELAERAIQLNHANPIAWACLGIAKSYLGKPEDGFQHTLLARTIAGAAPFRYQIDALSCIAGTMSGELDQAIHLAEASHALAPTFAPPLRYLSALYAHKGDHERSFEMVRKLQATEPDFSYDKLRDKAYPAAGLHRTSIINSLPAHQL